MLVWYRFKTPVPRYYIGTGMPCNPNRHTHRHLVGFQNITCVAPRHVTWSVPQFCHILHLPKQTGTVLKLTHKRGKREMNSNNNNIWQTVRERCSAEWRGKCQLVSTCSEVYVWPQSLPGEELIIIKLIIQKVGNLRTMHLVNSTKERSQCADTDLLSTLFTDRIEAE